MGRESRGQNKEQSKNIFWNTLLMVLIFGLLGANMGLYAGLILLKIATPFYLNQVIAKNLFDEMIRPGELGFKSMGGLLGYLGKIDDTVVFLPLFLILLFFSIVIYIRWRRNTQAAGYLPKKLNFLLIFFSFLIIVIVVLIFYWLKDFNLAFSAATNFGSAILVFTISVSLSITKFGEVLRRRPILATLSILIVGGSLWLFNSSLTTSTVMGEYSIQVSWLVLFLVSILSILLLFLLIGEGGLISVLAGEKWELRSLFLRGIIVIAFFLAAMIPTKLFWEYLLKDLFTLGEAGEPTRLGFQRLCWGMAIGTGIPLAVLGGTFAAMIPQKMARSFRLLALTLPFSFIVFIWAGEVSFKNYCSMVWEMDKGSLNEAASLIRLSESPPPRIALVLQDSKQDHGAEVKVRSEAGYPSLTELDLIPENIIRINNYLQARSGRWTSFTDDAQEARRMIASTHWLIDDLREIALENSLEKGSILNSILLLASLEHSPVTSENRRILERLSDERLFLAGGKACLRLARAWLTMGEPERAKGFYECAKRSLPEKDLEGFTLPGKPGFTEGKVMGRIIGDVTKRARVGFCYLGEKEELKDIRPGGMRFSRLVKAAMDLREDGSFFFEQIPEGRYFLALLLKGGIKGPFDIEGGGMFVVNRSNPIVNLGKIHILKSPQDIGPGKKD